MQKKDCPKLRECPFCKNEKIGIVLSRMKGVPSGDNGWRAEIKCRCGASMKVWALKRSWAEETIATKWNLRAGERKEGADNDT